MLDTVQYICLFYSFISFIMMVVIGFTDKAPPTDFGHSVIRAFGWPILLIHWMRFEKPLVGQEAGSGYKYAGLGIHRPTGHVSYEDILDMPKKDRPNHVTVGEYKPLADGFHPSGELVKFKDQLMFKNIPVNPLDFDIDEAVFYIKDEDANNSIHSDPTKVVKQEEIL